MGRGEGIGQPGVPAAAAWVVSMYAQKTLAVTIIFSPNVKEYKVLLHFKEGVMHAGLGSSCDARRRIVC